MIKMVDFQQVITGRKTVRGVPIPTKTYQSFERAAGRPVSTGRGGSAVSRARTPPPPPPKVAPKPTPQTISIGVPLKTAVAGGRLTRRLVEREAVRGAVTGLSGVIAREETERGQAIIARREEARVTQRKEIAKFGERVFKRTVSVGTTSKAEIAAGLKRLKKRTAAKPEFRRPALTAHEILEAQRFGLQVTGGAVEAAVTFIPSIPITIEQVVTKPVETATGTVQFAVTQPGRFAGGVAATTVISAGIGVVASKIKTRIAPPKITTQEAAARAVVDIETGRGFGEVIVTRAKSKPTRAGFEFVAQEFSKDLTKIDSRFIQVAAKKQPTVGLGRAFAKRVPVDDVTRTISLQAAKTPKGKVGTISRAGLEKVSEFRGPGQIEVAGRAVDIARIQRFKGLATGDVFKAGRRIERPVTGLTVEVAQVAKGGPKALITKGVGTATKTDTALRGAAAAASKAIEQTIKAAPKPTPSIATRAAPLAAPGLITRLPSRPAPPTLQRPAGPPSRFAPMQQIVKEPPSRLDTRVSSRFITSQRQFGASAQKASQLRKPAKAAKPARQIGQARVPAQRRIPRQLPRQIPKQIRRQAQIQQPTQRQRERQRVIRLQTFPSPKAAPVITPTFAAATVAAPLPVTESETKTLARRRRRERFRFFKRVRKIRAPGLVARV